MPRGAPRWSAQARARKYGAGHSGAGLSRQPVFCAIPFLRNRLLKKRGAPEGRAALVISETN